MKKLAFLILISLGLSGCAPSMKVAKIDSSTGYIESKENPIGTATVLKSEKLPLAKYKEWVFFTATNDPQYEFGSNQLNEIGYFDTLVTYSDLEKMVISNNLQDKVITLNSQIGMSRLAKHYKPFLWIMMGVIYENGETYAQLQVSDVEKGEYVLQVRTSFKDGHTDETIWYPLFNALIKWINENK
jgi:hypothetical protein